uniref:Dynactin subunit 4 n=1 Tax=Sinocyclocheilus anshuiensis TaxID=1608454 RepID=A0A671S7E7_9TELE
MATLLQPEKVLYLVRSEKKIGVPLSQLYFCRYCIELRSLECVSHEVDSHFCPSCLENMPSAEAKLKKNRLCLMHTCVTQFTCMRNNSRNINLHAHCSKHCSFYILASGGWQEPENPHTQRINKLIEYYQQLAHREKLERDRKKLARRRPFMPQAFSEKYGLGTRLQRQRSGAPTSALYGLSLKEGEDQKEITVEPAQALDEVEPLPEDYYTRPVNLPEVTTLRQRLLQPDFQPAGASQLHPRHKHLLMKRSLRCKKCEHNLSKPEFNPTSIKLKIQLVAVSYIPEVRIMSIPNLRHMKESQVLLTLTNPVESITHVSLYTCEEADPDDINSTAKVLVPSKELVLAGKDAAAEYDELAEPQGFQDDPDVVAFRKSNKIGFFIKVIPQREEGNVTVAFKLRHDFRNLAAPIRPTEEGEATSEAIWLTHHVELSLGSLAT